MNLQYGVLPEENFYEPKNEQALPPPPPPIVELFKADKTRRLLQWLIILFTVLSGGFLLLHFVFGTTDQATKAARVGFVATSAVFMTAVLISAIALSFFTKKTCGLQRI